MNTIKGLINVIVLFMKFLIWTILVLYGMAGLYLLVNGNPSKGTPGYRGLHDRAWEFAVYAFFITIILVPAGFIIIILNMSSEAISNSILGPVIAWYIFILGLGSIVGIINHIIAD